MLLAIIVGIVYTVWAESIPVAIITASLILFRAHRPSQMMQRAREVWYQRQAVDQ